VLAGSRDQMTPLGAVEQLKQRMPHAQLVVLQNAGHALMAEQPDAVLDSLIDFF
jgi:pimeloyl-ACP methyl ester carboxylesterase